MTQPARSIRLSSKTMPFDRPGLWIGYVATLVLGAGTAGACGHSLLSSHSPSAGAGYVAAAGLMFLLGSTIVTLATGLVAMLFARFRALGGVALAAGVGACIGLWFTVFQEIELAMIAELMSCFLGC
jgi:hypothetical protein